MANFNAALFINVIPETVACCGMAGLFGHIAKIMMKPMQFMRKLEG